MASLVRVTVIRYVLGGKAVSKGTRGAKRVKMRSAKWYAQGIPGMPGKRVPLAASRRAAEKMLRDMIERAECGRAGLPVDLPLGPLLEEWSGTIEGNETHRREVLNHARTILSALGVGSLAELRGRGLGSRVEAYLRELVDGELRITGRTAAAYGMHTRQFTRWLWRKRELLDADPLAGLDLPSQEPRAPRRDLTPEELARLLEAAAASSRVDRGLTGPDRALLYLTAAATGLRAGELASLTPPAFDLDADPPTVTVSRAHTKNGKMARQPIPRAVANRLRPYLAGIRATARVWPGSWSGKAADVLRADLAAACIQSQTPEGEVVFHSLRHTYASMLAGVAPVKVAQELVRHADPALTIGRYAHASNEAKGRAVESLPILGAAGPPDGLSRAELEELVVGLWCVVSILTRADR